MNGMRSLLLLLFALPALAGICFAQDPEPEPPFTLPQPELPADNPLLNVRNYKLDVGDFILVKLFDGVSQSDTRIQLDNDGMVTLPLVGLIELSGKQISEASVAITNAYQEYYREPNVSLQLLSRGRFEVFVFGPDFPGRIFQLENGASLIDVVSEMELDKQTLYRRLHLLRGGFDFGKVSNPAPETLYAAEGQAIITLPSNAVARKSVASLPEYTNWRQWVEQRKQDPATTVSVVDPLLLTMEGELSRYNVALHDKDVVYIPSPEQYVTLTGTTNSGSFELMPGETLGDMLRLSGTLDYTADLVNSVIYRFDDYGNLERLILNLHPALSDYSLIEDFELHNRDIISIVPRENRIFVLGEVNAAGAFGFREDENVLDYIAEAGGETPDAHLAWIAVIRQNRDRLEPGIAPEVIRVNFKEIHKGFPLCTDIFLQPGDVIYVPPKGKSFEFGEVLSTMSTLITGYAVVDNTISKSSN
ncbi:MAG: polysaccharide biosynthesis/export family protein [Planctomycetales bacterium]|nr:polysaccharide biosynthesis/export family protein [bacterium]UNM08038.1 MAG: polysaccharide biosynthesis/export family protein [Planctomycetales bacterium]